jgi:hypothetical protein
MKEQNKSFGCLLVAFASSVVAVIFAVDAADVISTSSYWHCSCSPAVLCNKKNDACLFFLSLPCKLTSACRSSYTHQTDGIARPVRMSVCQFWAEPTWKLTYFHPLRVALSTAATACQYYLVHYKRSTPRHAVLL